MATDAIKNRYDFVFLFDVKDGNPNGDPDQANLPRVDAENQEGLVTDVCLKRKVRNYVGLKKSTLTDQGNTIADKGFDIFIQEGAVLNRAIDKAKKEYGEGAKKSLCDDYFDIRAFGAVLSTGEKDESGKKGAGTVRGPVQFTFARSEDRIYQAEHSVTRCAVTKEEDLKKERTFGRKSTVPYALYRMNGFVSAVDAQKSGFSEEDLKLLWEALLNAFEHDRAAARGEMNPRALVVFKHVGNAPHLGSARSGELFDKIQIKKTVDLPRSWNDYSVIVPEQKDLPKGIELIQML
ncbi:type I-C CRISPR-associated protein Cas7/Csd2 [bacterium]|nr:MAG: type I-C CRISPR-associated protein Cas7/Csd2 [bacterium]